jgi:hypothetical protein
VCVCVCVLPGGKIGLFSVFITDDVQAGFHPSVHYNLEHGLKFVT